MVREILFHLVKIIKEKFGKFYVPKYLTIILLSKNIAKMKQITMGSATRYLGIPTILVKLHGVNNFGFSFLIDTSTKHNLIDPCFFEEWIVPQKEEPSTAAFLPQYPPVSASYQDKGQKRVICKDGRRRVCNLIKLDFAFEDGKYSELFALDPSLCPYFHSKGSKAVAGVLGNGFLVKHKWILDYSGM